MDYQIKNLPSTSKNGWPWTEGTSLRPSTLPDGSPWPKISVVTPSFNQAQYLEETIRSVLMQGYPNLEYIIIDGGSTDGSVEIIKKYETWLAYWVSEPDYGQSHAINKGWTKATGEIMAWLNSDDLYVPMTLVSVAQTAVRSPAGLIYGLGEYFNEDGIGRVSGRPYKILECLQDGSGIYIMQPAAFIRKQILEKVGYLDIRLKQAMDKDLWQRLAAFTDVLFVPEVWARFREHKGQLTALHRKDPDFLLSKEKLLALQNLFALPDLPICVRRLEKRAFAIAHIRISFDSRQHGHLVSAYKHAALAFTYMPVLPLIDRKSFRYLIYILAGPKLDQNLSDIKGRFTNLRGIS